MQHVWIKPASLALALAVSLSAGAVQARDANEDDAFASIVTL